MGNMDNNNWLFQFVSTELHINNGEKIYGESPVIYVRKPSFFVTPKRGWSGDVFLPGVGGVNAGLTGRDVT